MNRIKRLFSIILVSSMALVSCSQSTKIERPIQTTPLTREETGSEAEKEWDTKTKESPSEQLKKSVVDENTKKSTETFDNLDNDVPDFYGLDDPRLTQYIEDQVYAGLVDEFQSEDYIIENVNAIYYSKEYLQAVAYNSKANIWFGYNLEDLEKQFQGESYVFTLGENGETVVKPFEGYDDTYDKVIRNVAIGTGVILICVVVSVATEGVGTVPISMIFAAAAKSGTIVALSSGGISAAAAGAITGFQTKDKDKALKAAALEGSKDFMWGAILGALTGGISEASYLRKPATTVLNGVTIDAPEWKKAELRAAEKYKAVKQISYLKGKEVPYGTPGATRPDVVRTVNNHVEAIEVKYFNLENSSCRSSLYSELEREVSDRVINLPAGSTQRIVLDVTDRKFSSETINMVVETIQSKLLNIYGSKIPVDVVGL